MVLLLGVGLQASAQRVSTIRSLPDALQENSGLAFYTSSILYFINDGGNAPQLHRYDTFSNQYSVVTVLNASNKDWEDLAKDEAGYLYIGDFGNNGNTRKDLKIYKTINPELVFSNEIAADTISFRFENQMAFPPSASGLNFDCEAMVWYKDSLYLFTKNRTSPYDGWCYMYVLPDKPGEYVALLRDSVQFTAMSKESGWITGADLRNDTLVLLSSGSVHLAVGFGTASLGSLGWSEYSVGFSQKEAITFGGSATKIFISDELFLIGNKLYLLDLAAGRADVERIEFPFFKVKRTSKTLKVKLAVDTDAEISVCTILGNQVYKQVFRQEYKITSDALAVGNYLVQITVDGENYSFRWSKSE